MYTGIVEATGTVVDVEAASDGRRLRVESDAFGPVERSDSVSLSGVCVTAERTGEDWIAGYLSPETCERTYLGSLAPGAAVNVELAMPADGRYHGHVVKGTVDCMGRIAAVEGDGDGWRYAVSVPDDFAPYLAEKGAVALDGASLTVATLTDEGFVVAVIPETYRLTTLSEKSVGDPVHLEADLFARYVHRRLEAGAD